MRRSRSWKGGEAAVFWGEEGAFPLFSGKGKMRCAEGAASLEGAVPPPSKGSSRIFQRSRAAFLRGAGGGSRLARVRAEKFAAISGEGEENG